MTQEPQPHPLSARELEILRLLATGATNKEIASQLVISPNTVKVHLRNIYAKIEVASRTEASMWAAQHGLLDFDLPGRAAEPAEAPPPPVEKPPARRGAPLSAGRIAAFLMLLLALTGGILLQRAARPPDAPTLPVQVVDGAPLSRWQRAAALPQAAWDMAASAYDGNLYLFGGRNQSGTLAHAWRYEPESGQWRPLPDKPTPVSEVSAALLGEKIYLPGGRTASGALTDALEIYDPRQNVWLEGAPLPAPRSAAALAVFEGRLYLFGGWDGAQYAADAWAYDPQQDAWQRLTPMSAPRAYAEAVAAETGIHLLGGENASGALALHEMYAPAREGSAEGPWRAEAPLPQPVARPQGGGIASLVYVFRLGAGETEGWMFSENTGSWSALDAPPQPLRAGAALTPLGAYLHVLGGRQGEQAAADHWMYQAVFVTSIPVIVR